jgi:type IV pilus assembly protein PilN
MTTRLNLLPWREMKRREQDRQLLTIAIGAWMLMALAVFYGYMHVSALVENQGRRNELLAAEIKKVEDEIREIANIKKQRQDLVARMNVIYQLQANRTRTVRVFDELARRLPQGVQFTNIGLSGEKLVLKGIAQSNARISALMRNLDSSDWFAEPELEVINVREKGTDRISEFSMQVKQVSKKQKALEAGT